MAVAAGATFLGLPTAPVVVLYLSFELSTGMVRGRIREIDAATGRPLPGWLAIRSVDVRGT